MHKKEGWSLAQRAKYKATMEAKRNGTRGKNLVRFVANVLRSLPDEKLIQMVKE